MCFSSSARIDFSFWREKKKFKNAHLWTSSRSRLHRQKEREREREREREILVDARTGSLFDGAVSWRLMQFVSKFLVVPRSSTDSRSRLESMVRCFHWSNASSGGIIMVDSWTYLRGDMFFFFFLPRLCGQNFDLDRQEGAGVPTTARSLSCARSFAIPVTQHALSGRQRARGS